MSILYFRNSNGQFIQIPAIPGKSAYEIAVERGVFQGTEEEFAKAQVIENKEIIDQITQENIDLWNAGGNIDLSEYAKLSDLDGLFDDVALNETETTDSQTAIDFYSNGRVVKTVYFSGGSGTSATSAYISTELPENVLVSTGEDFDLKLDFSSPNLGKGTLKVFINDVDAVTKSIGQGESTTPISGDLFSKGQNKVVVYVLDRVGVMSNSLTFYVRYGGTEVTSTFDAYTSYDYGATVRYYFTPTALDTSLQLTFYMEIDGVTQAGVPCISDVRSYYTFPTNLSVGNHYCRAWVTDGTTRSNVLTFNLIILDATSLVVATDTLNPTVEEGTQLVLDYKVYMKNNTSFITKTYVDNNLVNTGTCTLETAYYRTTNLTAGTHTIKVEVFDITETYSDYVTWTVTVTESTYTMLEPATAGSVFLATAYNKSNVDENRDVWIGINQDEENIEAELSNFSFNSENGWIDDALVISGNSWVEIPIQPLANNAQYGFTLDIEFKTKAIGVEDAEVLTLWNETDNCGIKITTEQLILRSKTGSQCDLYFAEDEIVSAIFVIDRDEKTAKIYLNGVMCEAFALSDYEAAGQKFLEDFTVNSNVYLGGYNKNGYCAIKNIRIYEVALATNEILNNFMSNEKDKAAQRELVEFQKGNNLPTMTIYCDFAGLGKDDKKPCNIVYNSPDVNLYGESFTLDGKYSMLQYQGTSSMQYPIKNYRINPRNADGKVKLDPFNNGVEESRFTLKADFMSSGHWQNTGLAKWVNDKLYNYNVNDESTMNARKWYDLQNGGSLKDTRESINGFPCRLILVNDGETALNEGQQEPTPGNTKDMGIFNFNNDKDNVETLGFDTDIFPNCISFEVTANSDTSAGAFVPYDSETNTDMTELEYLQNSFELRYPDADDVGEDYGYLGMNAEQLAMDYWYNNGVPYTCRLSTEYFGKTITVDNGAATIFVYHQFDSSGNMTTNYDGRVDSTITLDDSTTHFRVQWLDITKPIIINGISYLPGESIDTSVNKDPYFKVAISQDYGLKRVIDWVGNCTDEQFVAEFDQYFHRDYTLRYYLLVITLGMVDNLGKNMMFDTFDGKIWLPRFYDMDTICSYDNSGEIKFDVDIEMEQGYWNTSASRLWTKIRDLMHDELVEKYNNMRQNGMSYESFMSYFYDKQIAQIPQTYYNKDYDVKYAPYADEYMGKAHGDGYEHLKRWLKRRLIFTDTLFDYAPSYENDKITIRANTLDLMSLEIETYTPVYQHISFYNGNMEKAKIDGKTSTIFTGTAQTATDQEVLIYGGTNIKAIRGIPTMNPNSMLIGNASRLTELDLSDCPILTVVNSNKANFSPHTYLNKLNISNCPQLGGTLNVSNSPLLQEVNALGTAVDNILFPTSVRNLETLRVPKTVNNLTLTDAGLLYTLEMEEGNNLQSISLTNCNNLTETINFDLTQTPTVLLDNSFNGEEIYMSATTNLTLRNMPSLQRVIFTPNSEYSAFDINNVLNGANYKITTFNNPMMTDFITTAPHRLSYNGDEYKQFIEASEKIYTVSDMTENHCINYQTGADMDNNSFCRLPYTEVYEGDTIKIESTHISGNDPSCWVILYDNNKAYTGAFSSNGCYGAYNTTNGEAVVLENGYMRIRMADGDTDGKIYYTRQSKTIMTKDITPNTAFTANTLDLADTQFQNVKFLCTTDVYNLKVPTTMKNFYCDSAMDIDTDIIEDASYEVIHEELIEPYTTEYNNNVYKCEDAYWEGWPNNESNWTAETQLNDDGTTSTTSYGYTSDYLLCAGGVDVTLTYSQNYGIKICFYDVNQTFISNVVAIRQVSTVSPSNTAYMRLCVPYGHLETSIEYKTGYTPNIIPSSANGSLIFNMYSNNTTQPTSTSPYMWDLTGLKLEDFYTYGMNNNVKASDDSYVRINKAPMYYMKNKRYTDGTAFGISDENGILISPILVDDDSVTQIMVVTSNGKDMRHYYSTDWNGTTFTQQSFSGGATASGDTTNNAQNLANRVRMFNVRYNADQEPLEWFDFITVGTTTTTTTRYYISDMTEITDANDERRKTITPMSSNYTLQLGEIQSITMPQRMSGYSVRLVNADITPDEYPTMLYPKLIDTTLPITGKLDYTKYNGTSLAWAYAYTTGDVNISPLDSRSIGQITHDYNKLYGTDFVDVVDVWAYKDTDVSGFSTNEAITKAYIELTSDNYKTRVDEVLAYYPNCTDLYFFDDGSVTSLGNLFGASNSVENGTYKLQVEHITFIEGYFDNCITLYYAFRGLENLISVTNLPDNVNDLELAFNGCTKLTTISNIPSKVTDMRYAFQNCKAFNQQLDLSNIPIADGGLSRAFINCSSLTTPPILPSNYTGSMEQCFQNCTALTQAPVLPEGITDMTQIFMSCSKLTTAPTIPDNVTNMNHAFRVCSALTKMPTIPSSVTSMSNCFAGCTSLVEVTDIPDSVIDMTACFYQCSSLTTPPTIGTGVTGMSSCFYGCTALTTPPEIPEGITNMASCFYKCTSLTQAPNIPSGVTNISMMLALCEKVTSITLPLANIQTYNGALNSTGITDITWVGERNSDFDITSLYFTGCSQEDIKELVPEHLGEPLIKVTSEGDGSFFDLGEDTTLTTNIYFNSAYKYVFDLYTTKVASYDIISNGISYNPQTNRLNYHTVTAYPTYNNTGDAGEQNHRKAWMEDGYIKTFDNGVYTINGQATSVSTSFTTSTSSSPLVINENVRVRSIQVFNASGTIEHNIIPQVDRNGKACLYDQEKGVYLYATGNNYGTYNKGTATLTLGETYLAYLTEEEITQATNKGWTLQ